MSGPARARVLATILLGSALALGLRAWHRPADLDPAPARTAPRSAIPLWSPRRLPTLLATEAASAALGRDLATLLAPYDSCVAVEGPNGALEGREEQRSLAPASTAKLLTAAAALSRLGAEHRFETVALVSEAPREGVVAGDVFLVGGGDPVLVTPAYETFLAGRDRTRLDPVTRLADLADAIAAAGVSRVEGGVVVDDTRHDRLRYLPVWKPSYRAEGQVGPLGALTVDDGFEDWTVPRAADDPAVLAGRRLVELLESRGVTVAGAVVPATAPSAAVTLATLPSPPLAAIVSGMLTSSDNLTAELLLREVAVASGREPTSAEGVAALHEDIAALGVDTEGLALLDGSGLAPDSRVSCRTIVAVLGLAQRAPGFETLQSGLAVAGETGTLALRFRGDPLAGVLHAKTGQIAGVAGLAGLVDDAERLRFAFIANGAFDTSGGQGLQAEVARIVAAFPTAPPTDQLVPQWPGAAAPADIPAAAPGAVG